MIILKVICIILFTIVIGFIINTIEDRRSNKYRISFKDSMSLVEFPIITFYQGNKELNFLLDTGSNISYINESVLKEIENIPTEEGTYYMGIDGNQQLKRLHIIDIYYKDTKYTETFCVTDLSAPFNSIKEESGIEICGILGSLFFSKYKYILDFDNQELIIKNG